MVPEMKYISGPLYYVKNHDMIAIEDLSVRNQESHLSKHQRREGSVQIRFFLDTSSNDYNGFTGTHISQK